MKANRSKTDPNLEIELCTDGWSVVSSRPNAPRGGSLIVGLTWDEAMDFMDALDDDCNDPLPASFNPETWWDDFLGSAWWATVKP